MTEDQLIEWEKRLEERERAIEESENELISSRAILDEDIDSLETKWERYDSEVAALGEEKDAAQKQKRFLEKATRDFNEFHPFLDETIPLSSATTDAPAEVLNIRLLPSVYVMRGKKLCDKNDEMRVRFTIKDLKTGKTSTIGWGLSAKHIDNAHKDGLLRESIIDNIYGGVMKALEQLRQSGDIV